MSPPLPNLLMQLSLHVDTIADVQRIRNKRHPSSSIKLHHEHLYSGVLVLEISIMSAATEEAKRVKLHTNRRRVAVLGQSLDDLGTAVFMELGGLDRANVTAGQNFEILSIDKTHWCSGVQADKGGLKDERKNTVKDLLRIIDDPINSKKSWSDLDWTAFNAGVDLFQPLLRPKNTPATGRCNTKTAPVTQSVNNGKRVAARPIVQATIAKRHTAFTHEPIDLESDFEPNRTGILDAQEDGLAGPTVGNLPGLERLEQQAKVKPLPRYLRIFYQYIVNTSRKRPETSNNTYEPVEKHDTTSVRDLTDANMVPVTTENEDSDLDMDGIYAMMEQETSTNIAEHVEENDTTHGPVHADASIESVVSTENEDSDLDMGQEDGVSDLIMDEIYAMMEGSGSSRPVDHYALVKNQQARLKQLDEAIHNKTEEIHNALEEVHALRKEKEQVVDALNIAPTAPSQHQRKISD